MLVHHRRQQKVDVATLAKIRLFAAGTTVQLAALARLFEEVERPAGTVLVREGEPGAEFYVIVEGTASAAVAGEKIATLGPGDFFGEMSLLDRAPRAATIVAETNVTLLVLDKEDFTSLVAVAPSIATRMMRTMSERLRAVETTPAAR